MISWILEARFCSAHFYQQSQWTEEKNRIEFGRCYTDYGHGHNYRLLAEWGNVPDSRLSKLREQFDEVVKQLDHEHLNFVIPEFKDTVPTTENICEYLRNQIQEKIPYPLLRLELFEDHDIGALWEPDSKTISTHPLPLP